MADNTIELVIRTVDQASAQIGKIGEKVGLLKAAADKAREAVGFVAAGFGIEKLVESITGAQASVNELNRLYATFGDKVGVSKQEIEEFGEQVAKTTTISNESARAGQAALLNFTSLTGERFKEVRDVMVDLAAVMGGDAKEAALTLGRALESPAQGIRILRQLNIILSPAQRELIENFQETGRTAQAQTYILDLLRQRLQGAALDASNTLGGALTNLKNSLSEAFEGQGANVDGVTAAIKDLAKTIQDPNFQEAIQLIVKGIVDIGQHAVQAVTNIVTLTEKLGELASKAINGSDSTADKLNAQRQPYLDAIARGKLSGESQDRFVERMEIYKQKLLDLDQALVNFADQNIKAKKEFDAATASAADSIIGDILKGNKQPAISGTVLKEILPFGQALGEGADPFGVLSGGQAPPSLLRKYFEDTQSDSEAAATEYRRKYTEMLDLLVSGAISEVDFNQKNSDLLDKLLPEIKSSQVPKKITVPIGEGVQLLQSGFEDMFNRLDFRVKSFGQLFLDVIKKILAQDFSQFLISNLSKAFDFFKGSGGGGGGGGGGFLSAIGKFFGFSAGGGQIFGPTIVGESGPELVWPGSGGSATVFNQRQLAFASASGSGGGNPSVVNYSPITNIQASEGTDTQKLMAIISLNNDRQRAELYRTLERNGFGRLR